MRHVFLEDFKDKNLGFAIKSTPGKKNMLVELPIWIIKHEKNLFLCISEPSAFYRHFVRPIPVGVIKQTYFRFNKF